MIEQGSGNRYKDVPDIELFRRTVSGEPEAFGAFYERYIDSVYKRILWRVNRHVSDAEDLAEDAFTKAFGALQDFKTPPGILTAAPWINKIADNVVLNHYRSLGRHPQQSYDEDTDSSRELPTQYGVEEHGYVELEDNLGFLSLLSRLTTIDHKLVLHYRYALDLSSKEIGELMGRSEGAVKVLQNRAIHALRKILGSEGLNFTP